MSKLFVIKNQAGLFLNRQQEWVSHEELQSLYRTIHRDEAVNTLVELGSKDIDLRGDIVECDVNNNNQPVIEHSENATAETSQPE